MTPPPRVPKHVGDFTDADDVSIQRDIGRLEAESEATASRISRHEEICEQRLNRLLANFEEMKDKVELLVNKISKLEGVYIGVVAVVGVVASIVGPLAIKLMDHFFK